MSKNIKRVKELEKNHRLLSDKLIDAIWILDVETFRFDYITESIKRISGYTRSEYMNFSMKDRMLPESFQKVMALFNKEISKFKKGKKNVHKIDVGLMHKSGNIYWAEIKARLFKEPGDGLKILGVTRDITEQRKAEQRKNDLIDKLERVVAEKEKLLEENKILKDLLPICSGCRRIRDDNGKWWPLDTYIEKHTETKLSHTNCPDCNDVFYGDQEWYINRKKNKGKP